MARDPVQINIRIPGPAYDSLTRSAKARGYSATGYATLLFEAAFAARVGQERGNPASDTELDEQVRLVFALAGQADVGAISKATGIKVQTVERILDGWSAYGKGLQKTSPSTSRQKGKSV